MASDIATGWCNQCQKQVALDRRGVNNILHLLLTILTAGVWLLVWLFNALVREPWHCRLCGSKQVRRGQHHDAGALPLAAYADTGVPLADEPYYCQSCERDTSFRRRADGAWFCTQCGTHFDADAGTNDYPFDATDDCPHCKTATLFRTLNAGTRFCTVCGTHDPTWADRAAPSALSHAAAPALSRTIIGARDLVYDDVRPSMPLPDDRHLQLAPPYSAAQWPEALALLEHARGDPKRFVIRRDHVSGYPPYTTLVACRLPGSPGRWVNLLVAFAEERGD